MAQDHLNTRMHFHLLKKSNRIFFSAQSGLIFIFRCFGIIDGVQTANVSSGIAASLLQHKADGFSSCLCLCENMVTVFFLSLCVESRLARSAAAFHVDSNPPCYFCLLTSGTGGNYINAAVAAGDVMRLRRSANYSPRSPENQIFV